MREQGLSASRLVEPRLQVALPSGKRSYKTCGRNWTGGGAVKTVHRPRAGSPRGGVSFFPLERRD